MVFSGVFVIRSLVSCVMFCRSLFVLFFFFSFFLWPLCCLSFVALRILITPLVSSNSSSNEIHIMNYCNDMIFMKRGRWSTIPLISTKRTIIPLISTNWTYKENTTYEVGKSRPDVVRHKNMAGPNQLMGSYNFIPKFPY